MGEIARIVRDENELHQVSIWIRQNVMKALKAGNVLVTLGREKRSLAQNKKLWPMLNDLSHQIDWNGGKLTPEQWKDLLTGSFAGQTPMPAIGGNGIVFIGTGRSTSKMNKSEFSELIEFIYSEGAELGVRWSEPAISLYEQYRETA